MIDGMTSDEVMKTLEERQRLRDKMFAHKALDALLAGALYAADENPTESWEKDALKAYHDAQTIRELIDG